MSKPESELDGHDVEQLLATAREYFRVGDFAQLSGLAHYLVTIAPDNAQAWHLAGLGDAGCGRIEPAIEGLRQAARLEAGNALVQGNLARLLLKAGRAEDALEHVGHALALDPRQAELQRLRGLVQVQLGQVDAAVDSFSRAIELQPDDVQALNNRGILHSRQHRHQLAQRDFERCLELQPNFAAAMANLGTLFDLLGQPEPARACRARAQALQAAHAAPAATTATLAFTATAAATATAASAAAAATTASAASAAAAAPAAPAAPRRSPHPVQGLLNQANALMVLGRLEQAQRLYDRAIALAPDSARAQCNRAQLLIELGRFEEARADLERAIALNPSLADAHIALSRIHLLQGRFEAGLPEYEWRWQKDRERRYARRFERALWLGQPSLAGRSLLLHAEQGLGDSLQFVRYAAAVRSQGARVLLEVPARLRALLSGLQGVDQLLARGQPLPPHDFHCPLGSLPLALGTRLGNIPAATPYLRAEAARVQAWRARIGGQGFKVAIAWQGSGGDIDRGRSFPLRLFAPLARLPGVRLISIQKHQGSEQLAALRGEVAVESLGPAFDAGPDAFLDTAAVMRSVDLVISSDTAVAHLAGALACPCWVLLKKVPDWRWLLDRDDSPWYPGMRLFRQRQAGDWAAVFDEVRAALHARAADLAVSGG